MEKWLTLDPLSFSLSLERRKEMLSFKKEYRHEMDRKAEETNSFKID
jgi:hypothetical protein